MINFCKAFDKVPHSRLFNKLEFYGIHGSLLRWIKNFLTDRLQQVIIDNKRSDSCYVLSGVPQGTVLAPLLFLIYINDLPLHVSSKIRLYADDVILYSNICSMADCRRLQNDLDSLMQWSHKWQMHFNPRKCEFLRITNKKSFLPFSYYINNCLIQEVFHARYLGVILDQHLSWNEHIKQIANKATKVNAFLYRNLYQCPPLVKSNVYKAMVRPIMEYSSTIWDPHTLVNINRLESVQKHAARMCFKNYSRFSSISSMLANLNLPTLQERRNRAKLQMLYKIIHQLVAIPDNCLTPIPSYLRSGYFNQLNTNIDCFKYSFFPSSIKLWNHLPPSITHTATYTKFCKELDNYYNHTCAL